MFQEDEAPSHYFAPDSNFQSHWIGQRGPVEYPVRSPELPPPDFFIWAQIFQKLRITFGTSTDFSFVQGPYVSNSPPFPFPQACH